MATDNTTQRTLELQGWKELEIGSFSVHRYKVPKLSGRLLCVVASHGAGCSHRRHRRPVSRDTSEPTRVPMLAKNCGLHRRGQDHTCPQPFTIQHRGKQEQGKENAAKRELDESLRKRDKAGLLGLATPSCLATAQHRGSEGCDKLDPDLPCC